MSDFSRCIAFRSYLQHSFSQMRSTKKPITVRIDPALLEQVRLGAAHDNRSVTNFIETALRQRLADIALGRSRKMVASRTMNGNSN
jgi:hypothetical protein